MVMTVICCSFSWNERNPHLVLTQKNPLFITLYLDNTDRFTREVVRCVEQEREEKDKASIPGERTTKRMLRDKWIKNNSSQSKQTGFVKVQGKASS